MKEYKSNYDDYVDFCRRYDYPVMSKLKYKFKNSPFSSFTDSDFSIGCRTWLFFGRIFGYQRIWDKVRDESLRKSKQALEEAFTPRLKKMLEDKLNEEDNK